MIRMSLFIDVAVLWVSIFAIFIRSPLLSSMAGSAFLAGAWSFGGEEPFEPGTFLTRAVKRLSILIADRGFSILMFLLSLFFADLIDRLYLMSFDCWFGPKLNGFHPKLMLIMTFLRIFVVFGFSNCFPKVGNYFPWVYFPKFHNIFWVCSQNFPSSFDSVILNYLQWQLWVCSLSWQTNNLLGFTLFCKIQMNYLH